jgi:hypothetical protein
MLILPESLEHEWADQVLLLWAERRAKRLYPPAGERRRHTDPNFSGDGLYCVCCSTWKPVDAFWPKRDRARGYERTCKRCRADQGLVNRRQRATT